MSSILKLILRNLIQGPSTIQYPFEDSPAPEKLRGKIKHNPDECVACHMCEYVCAGGAIRIQETNDKNAFNFVVWHNSCTFCGLCEYYCPTKAIHLTNDYHTAHLQVEKFNYTERTLIRKQQCTRCGEPLIPLSPKLVAMLYGEEGDVKGLTKMCEKCRKKTIWEGGVFKI
ncbi:4Fe-4S dicluster domain-containing protein [Bacillus sp. DNRA2]|uniref:4Fe-4S dicluster domain-containing protein n=1 Tax=Bacillus sp. DNRA2 TaxID=2723053 RepID=UPI00145E3AEA|nr:4Fe-4S dicluster domain-containing protein [Bacillus sp. DNRA2]NMD71678.1 4Fe-4S dicluster domain-containing protein [Bacillus sp. DNRA2]